MPDIPEPRFDVDLLMRVFGMDAGGRPFSQSVHARNISDHGAQLSGFEKQLKSGDTIGVTFGDKKARCKVMWVADAGPVEKIKAGVRLVDGQLSPWQKEIETQPGTGTAPASRTKPASKDKRKFTRHRIAFPIEIRDRPGAGAAMNVKTADIAGSGCYIETMLPFPVEKILDVTFWLNTRQIHTSAVVRTCDGGVGMGIEFTGLDEATQRQLQQQVESMAVESSPFPDRAGRLPTPVFSESSKF